MKESLDILELLASRYKSFKCVTGIAVCNEPSNTVPTTRLCRYYENAVSRIRNAGMPASRVAVVLPLFQRPEDEFIAKWQAITGGKHRNICFDVHCYHCFENEFHGKTLAQQLRGVENNAEMLRKYPMVVGEWSLALGCATWETCGGRTEDDVYHIFGSQQMRAFEEASHGHFFWNWTETKDDKDWNYQLAHHQGFFFSHPRELPHWDGTGEDPLEEELHPSPPESRVFVGDPVYIRVFHGRYIDVVGSKVNAQWCDKGDWQELAFWPRESEVLPTSRREVTHGDIVRLRARNGRFLVVGDDNVITAERGGSSSSAEFTVYVESAKTLRHRGIVYLRSRKTSYTLDADEEEEGLYARWSERGWWQQMAVEKVPEEPAQASAAKLPLRSQAKAKEINLTLSKDLSSAVLRAVPTPTSAARRRLAALLPVSNAASTQKNLKRRLASSDTDVCLKSEGVGHAKVSDGCSRESGVAPPAKMMRCS